MIPTQLATQRERNDRLSPTVIAETCLGQVLRRGDCAGRIVTDSRELRVGDCFVALPGEVFDGHEFVDQVIAKGAAGVVVSQPVG